MAGTFEGKRVVVLGGAGFLGSHLIDRVLADGAAAAVAVDSLLTGSERNIVELKKNPRFSFLKQDITEGLQVEGKVDFVFNMASPASPIDYLQIPLETLRVGSIGTENGLKLARANKAVFLQASTSEVYGDPTVHPQTEEYWGNVNPIGPRSVYDEAKRYGEAITCAYNRKLGVDTRIVRIFNTYGPRMRLEDGRVVPAFVGQALRGKDLTIFGDGKQTRSFCYASDLIDGICRLALYDGPEEERWRPVNIGNPREMTILEFADAIRSALNMKVGLTYKPYPQDDPKQRKPDITRAKALLGWEPRVSLEKGLQETIRYFQSIA